MADKYLKIAITGDNVGAVVNTVMMEESDFFDPEFKWEFVNPEDITPGIGKTIVLDPIKIITGNADKFEPFRLSDSSGGFVVSYDGNNVNIDCRQFDMAWMRAELTNLCKNNVGQGSLASASRNGALFEEYCIIWKDADKILEILETLK